LFSFAQDKAISCVTGGLLVANNKDYLENIKLITKVARKQSREEEKYHARYILLWGLAKRYYFTPALPFQKRVTIGKGLIMLFRWFGLIKPQASSKIENNKDVVQMSDSQFELLSNQLDKLDNLNGHRLEISKIYNESNKEYLLRYPILVMNPEKVLQLLANNKYICGRWYSNIVFPINDPQDVGYIPGSCPNAEYIVKHIINLPLDMDVTESDARNIKNIVSKFLLN
jgi:dTDP-4-amino-4,6-dideoxygalactose transaminase